MFNQKKILKVHFDRDVIGYSNDGWTYFLLSRCRKFAKIGHTHDNIRERLVYANQVAPYRKIDLRFWFAIDSAALEYDLHEYFDKYRAQYLLDYRHDCIEGFEFKSVKRFFTKYEVDNYLDNKTYNTYRDYFQKTNTELFKFPLPIIKSNTFELMAYMLASHHIKLERK